MCADDRVLFTSLSLRVERHLTGHYRIREGTNNSQGWMEQSVEKIMNADQSEIASQGPWSSTCGQVIPESASRLPLEVSQIKENTDYI